MPLSWNELWLPTVPEFRLVTRAQDGTTAAATTANNSSQGTLHVTGTKNNLDKYMERRGASEHFVLFIGCWRVGTLKLIKVIFGAISGDKFWKRGSTGRSDGAALQPHRRESIVPLRSSSCSVYLQLLYFFPEWVVRCCILPSRVSCQLLLSSLFTCTCCTSFQGELSGIVSPLVESFSLPSRVSCQVLHPSFQSELLGVVSFLPEWVVGSFFLLYLPALGVTPSRVSYQELCLYLLSLFPSTAK